MDPHLGQIALIAGPSTRVQWMISFATASPAYHVIVGVGGGMVMSAHPKGARLEPESMYPGAFWSSFPLTEAQAQGAANWALSKRGIRYNWVDDALITVECFTPLRFGGFVTRVMDNGRWYTCSQFADAALRYGAGYHVFRDGRAPGRVAPASFVPVFQENGWWPEHYWTPAHPVWRTP
jgi:hypothetical protein